MRCGGVGKPACSMKVRNGQALAEFDKSVLVTIADIKESALEPDHNDFFGRLRI